MPKSLIIKDLEDELVERLSARAARHGRSVEAELQEILKSTLGDDPRETFKARAAALRSRLAGRHHTPSEILLREDRGRRRRGSSSTPAWP